jgi:hypothetical protein
MQEARVSAAIPEVKCTKEEDQIFSFKPKLQLQTIPTTKERNPQKKR